MYKMKQGRKWASKSSISQYKHINNMYWVILYQRILCFSKNSSIFCFEQGNNPTQYNDTIAYSKYRWIISKLWKSIQQHANTGKYWRSTSLINPQSTWSHSNTKVVILVATHQVLDSVQIPVSHQPPAVHLQYWMGTSVPCICVQHGPGGCTHKWQH